MALIQCAECNREISDRATACPGCGAPVDPKKIKKEASRFGLGTLVLVVIFGLAFVTYFTPEYENSTSPPPAKVPLTISPELQAQVQKAIDLGLFNKVEYDDQYVYPYTGSMWNVASVDAKIAACKTLLAISGKPSVAIYDGRTGDRIGRYGVSSGLNLD